MYWMEKNRKIRDYSGLESILSLALGLGATTNEPNSYKEKVDRFQGFCEVMAILFSVFYMCIELEQFIRYEMYLYETASSGGRKKRHIPI